MKQYIIWFILLRLCGSDNLDYSDYHPGNIPFQNEINSQAKNPSPEYVAVMHNLCNNWQSPISYLQKRGYMPAGSEELHYTDVQSPKHKKKMNLKSENYFFFPQNVKERSYKDNFQSLDEEDKSESGDSNTELPATEIPTEPTKNETEGIIKKVKNKFLSIFSHKSLEDENEEINSYGNMDDDYYGQEFIDYPDKYETSNKRLFARSAPENTTKGPSLEKSRSSKDNLFSNLTDVDVQYIRSFINCFKNNKRNFQVQSLPDISTLNKTATTSKSSKDATAESSKLNVTGPVFTKSTTSSSIDSGSVGKTTSISSKSNATPECITAPSSPTFDTATEETYFGKDISKTSTTSTEDRLGDFTVDLDINQKNGTGEEIKPIGKSAFNAQIPLQRDSYDNKFITKSKFLAHLHHRVDEVGKPPHKPLDLAKVQEIIDKSKYFPTVIMSDNKATECAPLRLNDMTFDLEWNKIEKTPENVREKLNNLNFPSADKMPGQSLAAKFLQDVNSYQDKNERNIKTPYADNFLDSQQTLPDGLGLPLKASTKREAVVSDSASHGNKISKLLSHIASNSDSKWEDDEYESDSRRRTKDRYKTRRRKKPKPKSNSETSKEDSSGKAVLNSIPVDTDNSGSTNQFNSFDELNDIQFRVNDDDEEAISRFISNLNSPPEIFSFDVDKYLRSAEMNLKPQAPEFEYQSPEQRTFYEFLEAPAIEKEHLPLIEAPRQVDEEETEVEKLNRKFGVKRDLLRQYIKGVSSELNHNHPDLYVDSQITEAVKPQRSPNLDSDISFRTNNLIDGFSSNFDTMNSMKSDEPDDFVDNFYLLNDGSSQIYDPAKKDPDIVQSDRYSPQNLKIDQDLEKKFKELSIGTLSEGDGMHQVSKAVDAKRNVDEVEPQVNRQFERVEDFEPTNGHY